MSAPGGGSFSGLNPRPAVREILTRSGARPRGRTPSIKSGQSIKWESRLERLFCLRADGSPEIETFVSQPLSFDVPFEKRLTRYTPDFAVELMAEPAALVEVKPRRELRKHLADGRLEAIVLHLERLGHHLKFATEDELDRPEENLILTKIRRTARLYSRDSAERHFANLPKAPLFQLGDAIERLGSEEAVLHLVAHGRLFVMVDSPLSESTEVSRHYRGQSHKLFSTTALEEM